jgi:CDP-diglyceride synthetase
MNFDTSAIYFMNALVVTITVFVGTLVCLEIGRRFGLWHLQRNPSATKASLGAIEGAVFGLLGLMLAFTFSGAATRFEDRRKQVVEEANDIGTVWLRVDLLPAADQPALREALRQYLTARLDFYRDLGDPTARADALRRVAKLQGEIWSRARASAMSMPEARATVLLLPALNAMFDIANERLMALQNHPPMIIYVLIIALAFVGALLAGYELASGMTHGWLHKLGFTIAVTAAIYLIVDLEFPRFGLIRIDYADRVLIELRESMK